MELVVWLSYFVCLLLTLLNGEDSTEPPGDREERHRLIGAGITVSE